MNLEGKTAIVTGAAVRIGRAIAFGLAEAGANVCLHYNRSADEARATVAEIEKRGGRAIAVAADLQTPLQAAETIVSGALAEFARVDVLVNNASIFEEGTLEDTTEEDWDRHFAINLKSPFFLAQAFARALGNEHPGHIVNMVDWRGLRPPPGHAAYTLTKAGLIALTRLLAQELAPGIQVNAIAPGPILPPPGKDDVYLQRIARSIPLQRAGSPAELVAAIRYLLQSDFTTGEVLCLTGGEEL